MLIRSGRRYRAPGLGGFADRGLPRVFGAADSTWLLVRAFSVLLWHTRASRDFVKVDTQEEATE